MDAVASSPEDSSSTASLHQTAIKPDVKEEGPDPDHYPHAHTSPLCPPSPTSTSTDATSPQQSRHASRVKKKNKKKEAAESRNTETPSSAKQITKKCEHSEENMDSIFSTIEAVASGAWVPTDDKTKKRVQTSLGNSPKKKCKTKAKVFVKEKEEEMDESSGQCGSSDGDVKEGMTDMTPNTEAEEDAAEGADVQDCMPEPHVSQCIVSPAKVPEEDRGKDSHGDPAFELNTENRGSRKSERSCKGALYKTLVSEGMLTSLRANIDRGIP